MKKNFIAFLFLWSSLSANLPEQIEQLHHSLIALKTKLSVLKEGLEELKNQLNPHVEINSIQASVEEKSEIFIAKAMNNKGYSYDQFKKNTTNDDRNNNMFLYMLSLMIYSKNLFDNIDNIESKLQLTNPPDNIKKLFYAIIYLGIPFGNDTNQENKNKVDLAKFCTALNNLNTTRQEAFAKAMFFTACKKTLAMANGEKKDEPEEQVKRDDSLDYDIAETLRSKIFQTYNPSAGDNVIPYRTNWAQTHCATIIDNLNKKINDQLWSIIFNFLQNNDLSYLNDPTFTGQDGRKIFEAIVVFLSDAVLINKNRAHTLLIEIVKQINNETIYSPNGPEREQARSKTITLCAILIKNHYYEKWLLELMFDLLVRKTLKKNDYFLPIFINAFILMSDDYVNHMLNYMKNMDKSEKTYTMNFGNSHVTIHNKLGTYPISRDSFSIIFNLIASSLIQKIVAKKAADFTNFAEFTRPTEVKLEDTSKPEIKLIEPKDKSLKDYSYFLYNLVLLAENKNINKNNFAEGCNIIKTILNSPQKLNWLINETVFGQENQGLFEKFIESTIWIIDPGIQANFPDNYLRITPDTLEVADSPGYALEEMKDTDSHEDKKKKNFVRQLILSATGSDEQKTDAKAILNQIAPLGSNKLQFFRQWTQKFAR